MNETKPSGSARGLSLGIALISAATLGVEVLQTRLFSVMLWHHLTYMVVTVTLLGFAAGGSLLAIAPRLGRIGGDPRGPVAACCGLFGLSLIGAFALLAHSELDTLDIEQDRLKYFWLFAHYAYLVVPFAFAGGAIAIALTEVKQRVHATYFWNLLGSAAGSVLFVLLIRPLGGPGLLFAFASLAGFAGLCSAHGARGAFAMFARILSVLALLVWPALLVAPHLQKELVPMEPARSKAMRSYSEFFYPEIANYFRSQDPQYPALDKSLEQTRWTPLCRLDTLPIPPSLADAKKDREQPGTGPRSQVHVFQDGDAPTVIWSKRYAEENAFDKHFYGLGYRLVKDPKVLIIGPGGGNDIETALHWGASDVTAVDINGDTLQLVQNEFKDYTGDVYKRPKVRAVHSEGRSFLRREGGTYDLLQMSGTDTYAALSSGSYIFSESYLYTEEAFDDFFAHMSEDGVICVIRFNFEPPRETLKLVGTAGRSLRKLGYSGDLAKHFLVVHQVDRQAMGMIEYLRGQKRQLPKDADLFEKEPIRYSFTLMRKKPFGQDDLQKIQAAVQGMNQPTVEHTIYYSGGLVDQPDNHYTKLLAAVAKGPEAEKAFHDSYEFNTTPATDDKPFFFHLHTWKDVHLFRDRKSDSGYAGLAGKEPIGLYIMLALLVQTVVATLLLVILPLFRLGTAKRGGQSRFRVLVFFTALGLAYLLVEITTIQRFVLYLGHPTYSLTAGLAGFLLFSGLGSWLAGACGAGKKTAMVAALLVVCALVAHNVWLPGFLRDTLAASEFMRVVYTMVWIAPVAFLMGIPFPTGLKLLEGESEKLVPWAFGVNGAASVLSSIVSIILAMEAGFTAVFWTAALLYAIAAFTVPRQAKIAGG